MMAMASFVDVDRRDAAHLARIKEIKEDLGERLLILVHYYQRLSISLLADHLGDSYGLSALAARSSAARYIVFCGVAFMAESAEILRAPHQAVFHPHGGAGCPMADMADLDGVERAFRMAQEAMGKKVVPVAYMNTPSEIKAFCGRNGGIVCTSSNARKAFDWALARGEAILFLPDEHLGTNTAAAIGISSAEQAVFDPALPDEMNRRALKPEVRLILWKGYCHVHTWFTPEQVEEARRAHPNGQIVVHPECPREVVERADHNGSTSFMARFAEKALPGSTTIIGTETNLVAYLRHRFGKDKQILPLDRSFCPNMFKINLRNLRETLESLSGDRFRVKLDPKVKEEARVALARMLEIA